MHDLMMLRCLYCAYLPGRIFTDPVASSTTVFLDVFENRNKDALVSTRARIHGKQERADRARKKRKKKRNAKVKGKAEKKKAKAKNKHIHLYRLVAWGEDASLFVRCRCVLSPCVLS